MPPPRHASDIEVTNQVVENKDPGPHGSHSGAVLDCQFQRSVCVRAAHSSRFVRFGSFQLDLRARELSKNGIKVRVPDQSIQVLAKLLEHPGEVVTREELHQELWPNGTIVEFEHSIYAA